VTEQLAFEKGFWDGGAVDRHERFRCPSTGGMKSARKELLAGASLADQQNGDATARRYLSR